MAYTAVIVGSTGLVGSILLEQLLVGGLYDRVISLSRKRLEEYPHLAHLSKNSQLIQHTTDLFQPDTYLEYLKGDHLFVCTGTTQAKTPDKEEYYKIEHDLPLILAHTAKANYVPTMVVISALGADPDSRYSYNRGKGEMERDVEAVGVSQTYFVQPALLGGDRQESRTFEKAWKKFQKVVDPLLLGGLKKYRTIHPATVAKAMIEVACHGYHKNRIPSDELLELGK
jgi:uncharacterized protein YbjT (DUF2867 family)